MKPTILILAMLAGLILVYGCTHASDAVPEQTTVKQTTTTTQVTTITEIADDHVNVFVLTGENYKFLQKDIEAPELRVKKGDKVRVEFSSTNGFHDWVVDEFNAATDRVNSGGSTTVEFIADRTGTFEYYCSVGSHRAQGMIGKLIVE